MCVGKGIFVCDLFMGLFVFFLWFFCLLFAPLKVGTAVEGGIKK
jgi:hypothetical protein